jgi:acyl carrier protein
LEQSWREHLRATLPEYMIPSAFVMLERLPLTPTGKVNRAGLPAPGGAGSRASAYVAPRTPTEDEVCSIWASLLGVERVGVNDNFFELGGHSLLATQLLSRARAAFGVELPLRVIFESPTAAGFAAQIDKQAAATAKSVEAPAVRTVSRGERTLSDLLADLEQLSESDVQALLADRGTRENNLPS